ncbi:MAG: hypothetical protein JKY56_11065 [Kofleriaceae bacterium]|nr:hypothetical protein [Kofleriaceae bacterium]
MNAQPLRREVAIVPSSPVRSIPWVWWIACSLSAVLAVFAAVGISATHLVYPARHTQSLITDPALPAVEIHSTLSEALVDEAKSAPLLHYSEHFVARQHKGAFAGFEVRGLQTDGILMTLGLRNDDLIEEIAGTRLRTSDGPLVSDLIRALLLSRWSRQNTLQLVRSGKQFQIHVAIANGLSAEL